MIRNLSAGARILINESLRLLLSRLLQIGIQGRRELGLCVHVREFPAD